MFRTHIYNTCQPFEMLPSILGAEVILYLADELPQSRVIILTITIRNQVDDKRRRARCSCAVVPAAVITEFGYIPLSTAVPSACHKTM